MFTAALFIIAKIWNQTGYPTTNDWIKKNVVHICDGVLLIHKEE
jgi:hypothetical protein